MGDETGYTPLAHEEDCDGCCGCDGSADKEDFPRDEEGRPLYRPL